VLAIVLGCSRVSRKDFKALNMIYKRHQSPVSGKLYLSNDEEGLKFRSVLSESGK